MIHLYTNRLVLAIMFSVLYIFEERKVFREILKLPTPITGVAS